MVILLPVKCETAILFSVKRDDDPPFTTLHRLRLTPWTQDRAQKPS